MSPELKPVRILIVDDEPLVRAGIRDVLLDQAGIELVGEAGDGLSAITLIEQVQPDLVFLDVQMPGCDGFEVLSQLDPETRPAVVFVTAYEQYALKAFDAFARGARPRPDVVVASAGAQASCSGIARRGGRQSRSRSLHRQTCWAAAHDSCQRSRVD